MNPLKAYRLDPGNRVDLKDFDPEDKGPFGDKDEARAETDQDREKLIELQERLYAERQRSLLIVLQGMDTAGKDGTIQHVMSGVNPQGVQVTGFGKPSPDELARDYVWRVHKVVPPHGYIGIFNRSHYEDVLVVRVHQLVPAAVWQRRYQQINDFERLLTETGTTLLKFFLYIDKDEQKERLQARLDDPTKHWKFNPADLAERKLWDDYLDAYTDVLRKCSTVYAPWYIVPANRKWYRNWVITRIIVQTLDDMNPQFPPPAEGLDEVVIDD
jgi:PPK2 family polyphosphate:nucleotide phosphotransferase